MLPLEFSPFHQAAVMLGDDTPSTLHPPLSSEPRSDVSEPPSKRRKRPLEQETPSSKPTLSSSFTPNQTPTGPNEPPLHTPRTTSRYHLDSSTATGIVRRSNTLTNIISLIEYILKSLLEETDLPLAEEIGSILTQYWAENVTVLLLSRLTNFQAKKRSFTGLTAPDLHAILKGNHVKDGGFLRPQHHILNNVPIPGGFHNQMALYKQYNILDVNPPHFTTIPFSIYAILL